MVQLADGPAEVISLDVLDRMTEVIRHRGPDDVGTHVAPGIAIGVRRLSIVDVVDGHQPFPNEDGSVWAAQNGELYEHERLRDELRSDGHSFTSRCDTEVIPHLYEAYGDAFPQKLRGMFGIVVWDDARRRAVLARDRLGIKPLYYATTGDRLVFASELKSVLASRDRRPRARLRGDRCVSHARVLPGAAHATARRAKAASGPHARRGGRHRFRASVLVVSSPRTGPGADDRRAGGTAPRQARRVCTASADERCAARRDALGRTRLEPDRRLDGAAHERTGQDLRGRLCWRR